MAPAIGRRRAGRSNSATLSRSSRRSGWPGARSGARSAFRFTSTSCCCVAMVYTIFHFTHTQLYYRTIADMVDCHLRCGPTRRCRTMRPVGSGCEKRSPSAPWPRQSRKSDPCLWNLLVLFDDGVPVHIQLHDNARLFLWRVSEIIESKILKENCGTCLYCRVMKPYTMSS